jgi:hypothetical protein
LTVDKPNFELVAHLTGNGLKRTDNKRTFFRDRTPNRRKVRAATRSRGAPDQQIVCSFNHRAIPFASGERATADLGTFRQRPVQPNEV